MKYTKKELRKLPMNILRGIDIKNPEEEAIVQEIVNERFSEMPLENPLVISSKLTDNLTPEKERSLQEKIDKKVAELRGNKTNTVELTDSIPLIETSRIETSTETLLPENKPDVNVKEEVEDQSVTKTVNDKIQSRIKSQVVSKGKK